ncbi:hypothetical protein V7O66_07505 [Methanolobus sp. ZRKC3]|uniref:hypothetical protein n=1 Tax=Methanolobus sp. ZRKC3 TaxID=3125786 RepID=UPI0032434616
MNLILLENANILSLIVQFAIILLVILAVLLASRGKTAQHCKLVSIAVLAQIISILVFMSPVMSDFLNYGFGSRLLIAQIWIHHLAGIGVIMLVVYINLAMKGKTKVLGNVFRLMKITFALWILVFMGGQVIYLALWHGNSLL